MAVLQTNCKLLCLFQKLLICQPAPVTPSPVFGPSVHQSMPRKKQCLQIVCPVAESSSACIKPEIKSKGLAVAPIGLRYHAKENGALALFSKPKWASGEILVHVIHAKQNETELH